jgi:hypothetical protein
MRIRPPKPLHGWRAFVGEVGVIVLGVLIALGASQALEAWQWQQQVKLARQSFKDELGAVSQAAYIRLAEQSCISSRLTDIQKKLREPGASWQPMDTNAVSPTIEAMITTEGWSNALASGTLNHLGYGQSVHLSNAYAAARQFAADQREEGELIAKLEPIRTASVLDLESRISLLQTTGELDRLNFDIYLDAVDLVTQVTESDLGFSLKKMRTDNADFLQYVRKERGACVKQLHNIPGPPSG